MYSIHKIGFERFTVSLLLISPRNFINFFPQSTIVSNLLFPSFFIVIRILRFYPFYRMSTSVSSPFTNSLRISATKLYSPMRYDPFIHDESNQQLFLQSSMSSSTADGSLLSNNNTVTYRGLDNTAGNNGNNFTSTISSSSLSADHHSSTVVGNVSTNREPSLNASYFHPHEPSVSNSTLSSTLLHPPHYRTGPSTTATLQLPSLAEELSITEMDFWENRVALRNPNDTLIIQRQRQFNPLLPQGTPHTLRTSRFQRTTAIPEMQNPKPKNNYAALRKNHLSKHTQCCGQFGPIHASTCIAMKTGEYSTSSTDSLSLPNNNDLIDPKHPLLTGIKLVDALQTTRLRELTIEQHKHEDIEWERRYWLNTVLNEKERKFQSTQRLSTKAMYETRNNQLHHLRNNFNPSETTTKNNTKQQQQQRPLPPATRKPIPWQYIDPLRPEYSLLGNLHDTPDTDDVSVITGGNSITKLMKADDNVTYPSLYTIPTHTYNSGALFGFSKELSNRTFRANQINSPEIQAYSSIRIENEDVPLDDPRNITSSSASSSSVPSATSSFHLPPLSASSSVIIDNVSVGTNIDPRYRWRAPARPGPEYERQQLLRQHKGTDQWSKVPVGAHSAGKDAVHVVRPSILASLSVE